MRRTPLGIITAALIVLLAMSVPAHALTVGTDPLQSLFFSYGNTGTGWTGADGTYSVRLPDGREVWMFSDTFLGPVNDDGSRPTNAPFIHNSFVVQDGGNLTTLYGGTQDAPNAFINPPDGVGFYWMGAGIVERNALSVFVNRFVAAPIPYGFQQAGVDIATFSLPSLRLISITREPLAFVPGAVGLPVSYGSAVVQSGPYTYIYGVEDAHIDKYLHVARSLNGTLGSWEYFTGSSWSTNPLSSARIMSGVANELSVQATASGFLLVTQQNSVGPQIEIARASAPEGPWSQPSAIYTTPESSGSILTYNAKAHPELGDDTHLVITYNVNSSNTNDVYTNVDNYRPRWIDVSL
ncbi:MAG: DUF5005 domain-containing protein [Actinomycetota bacterium]